MFSAHQLLMQCRTIKLFVVSFNPANNLVFSHLAVRFETTRDRIIRRIFLATMSQSRDRSASCELYRQNLRGLDVTGCAISISDVRRTVKIAPELSGRFAARAVPPWNLGNQPHDVERRGRNAGACRSRPATATATRTAGLPVSGGSGGPGLATESSARDWRPRAEQSRSWRHRR